MHAGQQAVFAAVLFARLVVPLWIPRFPLPAVLLSLIVDGLDQTVFQAAGMTRLIGDYQRYDKALDVYYLVIAYTATLRNWPEPIAFRTGLVLWYWRLAGVLAFELSGWRPVLLIFPNTFEYYFLAYEAVRTCWRPDRLGGRRPVLLAAGIWVVIKLPQEYWIHVAHLDATDQIAAHPLPASALGVLAAVLLAVVLRRGRRLVPAPDWPFTVDVDAHQRARRPDLRPESRRAWLLTTAEKVVLTAAIVVIFSHILPSGAGPGALAVVVAAVTALNAGVSEALEWRHLMPARIPARFALMLVINTAIFELIVTLAGRFRVDRVAVSFFLLLLSLIITLYDQFRGLRYGISTDAPGPASSASSPA